MKQAGTWMVLLLAVPLAANAANVRVSLSTPAQVGISEKAQVGMSVEAEAFLFALTAGGGYTLTCPDTTPLTAQRAMQFVRLAPGFKVSVFVPETIPAVYVISGWYSWARPSTHYCTFSYTGRARDGLTTLIGIGVNVALGGDEAIDGNSVVFPMHKPPPPPPVCEPFCSSCNP